MESSERPEKQRKLGESSHLHESQNNQTQNGRGPQVFLHSPRVLVNKLQVRHDVIERLRRITKVCGKQMTVTKRKHENLKDVIETDEPSQVESSKETVNDKSNARELEKASGEERRRTVKPEDNIQEWNKETAEDTVIKPPLYEDGETAKKATLDIQLFKEVLREMIEKRTKIVEAAVEAESIQLRIRMRELERENSELQRNAKTMYATLNEILREKNEKVEEGNVSRGLQVSLSKNPEVHAPTQAPREISTKITFAEETIDRNKTMPFVTVVSSVTANAVASVSNPKSNSELFYQTNLLATKIQTSAGMATSTNVVYAVRSRPANPLTEHLTGSEDNSNKYQHDKVHVPQLRNETYHLTKNEQSSHPYSPITIHGTNNQQVQNQTSRTTSSFQSSVHPQLAETRQRGHQHQQQQSQQQQVLRQQLIQSREQHMPVPVKLHHQPKEQQQQQQQQILQPPQSLSVRQQNHQVSGNPFKSRTYLQQQHQDQRGAVSLQLQQKQDPQSQAAELPKHLFLPRTASTQPSTTWPNSPCALIHMQHTKASDRKQSIVPSNSLRIVRLPQSTQTASDRRNSTEIGHNHVTNPQHGKVADESGHPQSRETARSDHLTKNGCYKDQLVARVLQPTSKGLQTIQTRQLSNTIGSPVVARKLRVSPGEGAVKGQWIFQETEVPPGVRVCRPSPEYFIRQQQSRQSETHQPEQTCQQLTQLQTNVQRLSHAEQAVNGTLEERACGSKGSKRPPVQSQVSSTDILRASHPQDGEKTENTPTALNTRTKPGHSTSESSSNAAVSIQQENSNPVKPLPKPSASIAVMQDDIVLSWNMTDADSSVKIDNYELFAFQDPTGSDKLPIMWKKIGIVKALPLPMACTLTQFTSDKYYFAVRAVDEHERAGPFSDACSVTLTPS